MLLKKHDDIFAMTFWVGKIVLISIRSFFKHGVIWICQDNKNLIIVLNKTAFPLHCSQVNIYSQLFEQICTTARDSRLVWQHRTWVRRGIAAGGTAQCQNQFHCHCCVVWGREVAKLAGPELSADARTLRVEDRLPVPDLTRTNFKLSWHLLLVVFCLRSALGSQVQGKYVMKAHHAYHL